LLLEIEDIRTGYTSTEVVHGVSLSVAEGSAVGVIGANGAGKSALLHAVCGLLPHTGRVVLDGTDISTMPAYERARRGLLMVPEGRRVFPGLSVQDNLLSASLHPKARRRREEVLASVYRTFPRLQERLDQMAETLSGGEQQMLAIARTLMGCPTVMMLDEPSLGLSPLFVQEVFRVIGELRNAGLTILLVEQNVHHCLQLTDTAHVLEHGRVALSGKSADLLEDDRVREAYLGSATSVA
jgi:branched-chain amino acid transport system ATP-binding protein